MLRLVLCTQPRSKSDTQFALRSLQRGADDAAFAITVSSAKRLNHDTEADETVSGERCGNVALGFG